MKIERWPGLASVLTIALLAGCGEDKPVQKVDGSKYLLSAEPEGAAGVRDVRESAKDEDKVVVVGRIGGMEHPFVEGMAAFSIVDPVMKPCNEIGDDACPIPWDYCCGGAEELSSSTALIKVVDESGQVVKSGAKELLDVKELSTVVVQGKVQRDDNGKFTVVANAVFVKK